MRKVYLIFAPQDEPFAIQLAQKLQAKGFEVEGSRTEDTWENRLTYLIQSEFAIYLVSARAISDENWQNLIDEAVRRRIPVQGILIEGTDEVFPEPGTYPVIDMTGNITEQAMLRLERTLGLDTKSNTTGPMLGRRWLWLLAIILFAGIAYFAFSQLQDDTPEITSIPPLEASLLVTQPQVAVRQNNNQWQDVADRRTVRQGYSIRTDNEGNASLVFMDGDKTEIGHDTIVTLDVLSSMSDETTNQVRLSLSQGQITNSVVSTTSGSHQVHTSLADIFADESVYTIMVATNGTVTLEVIEGAIEILQNGERRNLNQGEVLTLPSRLAVAQTTQTAAAYTNTPTPTVTMTITPTATSTETVLPTTSPTETVTPTPSHTSPSSPSETVTEEPVAVLPSSPTGTVSETVAVSDTPTMQPSVTSTPSRTVTPSRTPRNSATPTQTVRASNTPTVTRAASSTRTPSATASRTLTSTATRTVTRTRTHTPTHTYTPSNTPTPTATWTPSVTPLPTNTLFPTRTATGSATATIDPNSVPCPGAPLSRLYVGDTARVIVQSGLSLRDEPGFLSVIIAYLAYQEEVLVIDGPVCANDFRWWYVRTEEDVEGWSAEGGIDAYYLEPAN
ncbi:MAG: FecR domain-containing protein [Anaerolineales bacterium]|nr:FecR domain-containing protein [Anaerolineales bacterium]